MIVVDRNSDILVNESINVREALRRMNKVAEGILFVVDENRRLMGTMTDGDIRRGLLSNKQMTDSIEGIYNRHPFVFAEKDYSKAEATKAVQSKKYEAIPIVNDQGIMIAYEKRNGLLEEGDAGRRGRTINIPVVIMAGGRGTRMEPFTAVLPKPLIPVGSKTILEMIIDEFKLFGVLEYYITVNYRAEMIQAYFNCVEHDYEIHYLREKEYYGTAGSLVLLPKDFAGTFIVSNCDILVRADYYDVLDFHRKSGASLTVLSSIQHHVIPYGVIKFENGGVVTALEEKPEFAFCINTGVYILESDCLGYIPRGNVFHMTNLIETLMSNGRKVVTYPVSESEYVDLGQWEEYRSAVKKLGGS